MEKIASSEDGGDKGRRVAIEAQLLEITRELLRELGNTSAIDDVRGTARLDEDLGLESIERAELLARMDRALGISLPESAIAEARTLDDVVTAVAGAPGTEAGSAAHPAGAEPIGGTEPNSAAASATGQAARPSAGLLWTALDAVYGIYAAGIFIVWLVLAWLLLKVMPSGQPAARMTSTALRIYFRLIGPPIGRRVVLIGGENIAAYGASIYVSNHTSYSDVLVVLALFRTNYHFVAKSEINDMPLIGSFLRKLGHFSFDRAKVRSRSRQVEQMEQALMRGESVFVFAEGTFSAQPGVRPFHLGAFRASVKTGRPIIPVAVRGAREFLRDGTFLPKPRGITLTVSPALFPVTDKDEGQEWAEVLRLRDETRRIISSHAGEPMLKAPPTGQRERARAESTP